jgi:uncharacterized coiled-coil DUF342 family protein
MEEQSDTPRTEMAEGQRLNPYFEGRFDGESDELCALRLTLARERDEARAIANDRDAMVDHRDRALTAMYQRVDVITQERDEARAEVERLRKTLDEIATYWNGSHRPAETLDAAEWTQGVAEEALAATKAKP